MCWEVCQRRLKSAGQMPACSRCWNGPQELYIYDLCAQLINAYEMRTGIC